MHVCVPALVVAAAVYFRTAQTENCLHKKTVIRKLLTQQIQQIRFDRKGEDENLI